MIFVTNFKRSLVNFHECERDKSVNTSSIHFVRKNSGLHGLLLLENSKQRMKLTKNKIGKSL